MIIGDTERFAFEFDIQEDGYGEFDLIINDKRITRFRQNETEYPFKGSIIELAAWFEESKSMFFDTTSPPFPVPLRGNTIAEKDRFYRDADFVFTSEDEEFDALEDMADWMYKHSWVSARGGGFLLPASFYSEDGKWLEISWVAQDTYSQYGAEFVYKEGVAYVEKDLFEEIIDEFITEVQKMK
jgi:hypothetical protein